MKTLILFAVAVCVLAGDKRPFTPGKISDDNVEIRAKAYLTKEEIKASLGHELDEGFIVVDVDIIPKNGQTVKVDRDYFVLISGKDGQKSSPYLPSQIAGSSALMISGRQSGGAMAQERRRPIGGIGGMGLPSSGGSMGSATAQVSSAQATERESDGKEDPVMPVLKKNILPEKEITEPLSGQLYFMLEGKQKLKDLDLYFKVPGGRLDLRFAK